MAMSQEHGSTLQEVQQLMKKNQVRGSNQPTHSTEGADTIISFFFCSFFFFLTLLLSFLNLHSSSFYKQMQSLKLSLLTLL